MTFLSEIQSFLLSVSKERWEPASPISLGLAATAVALYAFKADLYSMMFALGISAAAAWRRAGIVLRISAATAAFTAFVYALGLLLARGFLPQEALHTLYRAVSSAALLGAFVAMRGFTPAILSLTCLGFNGAVIVAMLKSVLLAPNALDTAVSAYKALRGRLDLQGGAFAAVYMLRRIETRYREIYTVSTMLTPLCKLKPSLSDITFIVAIVAWLFV
ncbi:hypothetical protein Pogu_0922 [Pyrobaculum oguniense TE7]|uniref:Uncharacterized protein n=1 Tax=Pyrobaculum oguniense (strain DSM 13380 / JCM 10595 / TE7) TaxID=698757 RepID=H6Q8E2_PYROT|nr:hypothetical protein Pogu_0922 [Pyrobaculum oguniense TE7]